MDQPRKPAETLTDFLDIGGHWRTRAAGMRVLARRIDDDIAKALILRTANDYDDLAERAGEHARQPINSN